MTLISHEAAWVYENNIKFADLMRLETNTILALTNGVVAQYCWSKEAKITIAKLLEFDTDKIKALTSTETIAIYEAGEVTIANLATYKTDDILEIIQQKLASYPNRHY